MSIARSWAVAIALATIAACAQGRTIPSHLPAAPNSASDIFTRLGLEGLTLDMFPGEKGDTVTRTFSDTPGETKTVTVTRSPTGAVTVQKSTQFVSSIDGLPSSTGGFPSSSIDFSTFKSAFESVKPQATTGSVIKAPAPVKSTPTGGAKLVAPKAKPTGVAKPRAAPKKKAGKKSDKKTTKSTTKTETNASEQSAVVVAPLEPVEKESFSDFFTINGDKAEEFPIEIPSLLEPVVARSKNPAPSAPKGGRKVGATVVTPASNAGAGSISAPGRVGVRQNTRASTRTGPTSDFKASRVAKDGVTATVVSGSSVAPTPVRTPSVVKATGDACSDTETSAAAVERCVNAVRQNPAKYAKLLSCTIPAYTPRSPLVSSSHLSVAAAAHARDMASIEVVTHTGSDGSTMGKRIWERAGFVGSPIAENVAGGQRSAKDVVFAWMCSSGHRKNIMSCEHDSMGTGLTRNGRVYWAQTFGCTKYNKCKC